MKAWNRLSWNDRWQTVWLAVWLPFCLETAATTVVVSLPIALRFAAAEGSDRRCFDLLSHNGNANVVSDRGVGRQHHSLPGAFVFQILLQIYASLLTGAHVDRQAFRWGTITGIAIGGVVFMGASQVRRM